MSDREQLTEIRARINKLDEDIQSLVSERAECALEVARQKHEVEKTDCYRPADCYRPEREAQIIRAVVERNQGPLGDQQMANIFREIMSACLALQKPLNISFLGPEGTYSQEALIKHFGSSVNMLPESSINEIFHAVEVGNAQYGIVPVENSTEGVINHTLDMFMSSSLKICGEVEIRIHHNLLSTCEQLNDVTTVYAHQTTLAQCRQWLNKHLPHCQRIAVSSNGEAAKIAIKDAHSAAIASVHSSTLYQLNNLQANIEDNSSNTTRFIIIGERACLPSGDDKTSIMMSSQNKAGALSELLLPFSEQEISLFKIESRPSNNGLWEYVFFLDFEGHVDDKNVQQLLSKLESRVVMIKLLGSYPKAATLSG